MEPRDILYCEECKAHLQWRGEVETWSCSQCGKVKLITKFLPPAIISTRLARSCDPTLFRQLTPFLQVSSVFNQQARIAIARELLHRCITKLAQSSGEFPVGNELVLEPAFNNYPPSFRTGNPDSLPPQSSKESAYYLLEAPYWTDPSEWTGGYTQFSQRPSQLSTVLQILQQHGHNVEQIDPTEQKELLEQLQKDKIVIHKLKQGNNCFRVASLSYHSIPEDQILDRLFIISSLNTEAYIRHLPNGKWRVYSEKSHRNMGTYDSEEAAKHRLSEIEFFKHKKGMLYDKEGSWYPRNWDVTGTPYQQEYHDGPVTQLFFDTLFDQYQVINYDFYPIQDYLIEPNRFMFWKNERQPGVVLPVNVFDIKAVHPDAVLSHLVQEIPLTNVELQEGGVHRIFTPATPEEFQEALKPFPDVQYTPQAVVKNTGAVGMDIGLLQQYYGPTHFTEQSVVHGDDDQPAAYYHHYESSALPLDKLTG